MHQSPRARKAARLSDSFQRQLTAYTLNASVAGVGMLALARSAEAKVIYTPVHERVVQQINLDVNNDGTPDFRISCYTSGYGSRCRGFGSRPPNPENWLAVKPLDGSNAVWSKSQPPFVSAIAKGKRIGRKGTFPPSDYVMAKCIEFSSSYCFGPWLKVNGRYLGLKFVIKGKIHFGWARLNVDWTLGEAILTGYAYETIPGKSIMAGQTFDILPPAPDSLSPDDPGPGASLTNPIPDTQQPASLGLLALGAPGLAIWRREESVDAKP
jgi:hypothetical protein